MLPNQKALLCLYHYDPLDQLVNCTSLAQPNCRRFYLKGRLTTEVQDLEQRSILQHEERLLAQQMRQKGAVQTHLFATDKQRSVFNALGVAPPHPMAYAPYGHRPAENGLLSLLGFNGERPDPVTGWYLLGNGYRAFNPVLMRFNSPDSWSPFGEGGLNAYAYCVGDPVNRTDPTGHKGNPFKAILGFFKRTPRTRSTADREFLNPLARPQTSATLAKADSGQPSTSSLSRSSVSSQVSKTDSAPYDVSFREELPPSYQNLYPNTELVEPDIGFRFEQALRRSKNDLDYLEMLLHDPEQAPALNVIQHDIRVINGIIKKLYALHDEATLPPYPPTPVNRQIRRT